LQDTSDIYSFDTMSPIAISAPLNSLDRSDLGSCSARPNAGTRNRADGGILHSQAAQAALCFVTKRACRSLPSEIRSQSSSLPLMFIK